jgi:hypothetical protein
MIVDEEQQNALAWMEMKSHLAALYFLALKSDLKKLLFNLENTMRLESLCGQLEIALTASAFIKHYQFPLAPIPSQKIYLIPLSFIVCLKESVFNVLVIIRANILSSC